jgi:hypothetical protein
MFFQQLSTNPVKGEFSTEISENQRIYIPTFPMKWAFIRNVFALVYIMPCNNRAIMVENSVERVEKSGIHC